jgi:hypothetical protein
MRWRHRDLAAVIVRVSVDQVRRAIALLRLAMASNPRQRDVEVAH